MIFPSLRFLKPCCLFVLLWASCTSWVQAEIYKSVDAEGHITYSSTPSRGAKKLGLEPFVPPSRSSREPRDPTSHSSRSSRSRSSDSPYDFPRVDSNTQRRRDDMRFRILADELASEEKLLAQARANLKQGEAARNAAESHAFQDDVTLHVRNISALKTEMSHIK